MCVYVLFSSIPQKTSACPLTPRLFVCFFHSRSPTQHYKYIPTINLFKISLKCLRCRRRRRRCSLVALFVVMGMAGVLLRVYFRALIADRMLTCISRFIQ